MTLRQYLFWMLLSTVLCWLGWFAILETVDPASAGLLGLVSFYASFSLALIGTFAMIGLAARAQFKKHEPISRHVSTSFRQSLLLACLVGGSLFLQSRSVLTWWNLVLFTGTLTILEFFLVSARGGRG